MLASANQTYITVDVETEYKTPANSPVLIAARRWIKSKQKFSGVVLLVCRKSEVEKEE
jgi:hypothetical protein